MKTVNIHSDSGAKVNDLGGDSIGHGEIEAYTNMCLILNGY